MSTSDESGDNTVEDGDDSPDLDSLGKQEGARRSITGKKRTRSDVSIQGAGTSAGISSKSERTPSRSKGKERRVGTRKSERIIAMQHSGSRGRASDEIIPNESQEEPGTSAGISSQSERTPSTGSKGKERRIGTRKSPRIAMKHSRSSGRATDEMGNKEGSLRIRKSQEEPGTSDGTSSKSERTPVTGSKGKERRIGTKKSPRIAMKSRGSSGRAAEEMGNEEEPGTRAGTSSKSERTPSKGSKGKERRIGTRKSARIAMKRSGSSGRAAEEMGNEEEEPATRAGTSSKCERTPSKGSKGKERRIGTRKSPRIAMKHSGGAAVEMGNEEGSLRISNENQVESGTSAGTSSKSDRTPITGSKGKEKRKRPRIAMKHSGSSGGAALEMGSLRICNESQKEPGMDVGTSSKMERTPGSKGKERRIGTRKSLRIAMKDSGLSGRATDKMGNKKGSLRIRNKNQDAGTCGVTISESGRSSSKDSKGNGRFSKRKKTGKKDNNGGGVGSSSGRSTDEKGKKKESSKTDSSSERATVSDEEAKGKANMSESHVTVAEKKKKKDGRLRIGENAQERGSGKEEGKKVARTKSLRMQASNAREESPSPKPGGSGSKKEPKSKKGKK